MKHVIRKMYFNYEKEEKWLNEMVSKGLGFVDYSWGRYVFEDSSPGEYIYRIELLEWLPSHPESLRYIRFMEENGVEHVSSYLRWVYFRKKASDGKFDIYSDINSRIKHLQRIFKLYLILGLANIPNCINQFVLFFTSHDSSDAVWANLALGCALIVLSMLIISLAIITGRKIRRLKREKKIHGG